MTSRTQPDQLTPDTPTPTSSTPAGLVAAALGYAAAGIAVVPLPTPGPDGRCSCRDGTACDSPGKHPRLRNGLRGATRHPAVIRAWWRLWPQANIGLATGTVLDVCDVDTGDGLR